MKHYLNHASISPLLGETKKAISEAMAQRSANQIDYFPLFLSLSKEIKRAFGSIIDAAPEQLSIQPNTATSMSILANGFPWGSADEIILLEDDFPSTTLSFIALSEKGKVKIRLLPYQDFLDAPEQSVTNAITKNTRMMVLSDVGYMSGARHPIEKISKICQEKNIFLAVDGTQGIGVLPLSMQTTPVDFLAVSAYKWLMCPLGVAFFYISQNLMAQVQPSIVGWLSSENPASMTSGHIHWASDATKYENGGKPLLPLIGANASLKYLLNIGFDKINSQTIRLATILRAGLAEQGFDLCLPNPEAVQSGIVTIKVPTEGKRLFDYLNKNDIAVTYRNHMLRFSPHFYQDEGVIHEALGALEGFRA